jgi:hypothetical protein
MRPILWYVVFVGVPLLALFGILRLGEGLPAPRAVHGEYAFDVDSSGAFSCLTPRVAGGERRMTISQSGTRLELNLIGEQPVAFRGTIAGDTIRTAAARTCLTADSSAMSATVERTGSETELVGHLELRGCSTCPRIPFRARRLLTQPQRGGA